MDKAIRTKDNIVKVIGNIGNALKNQIIEICTA
jgi:hypothetical protein